MSARPMSTMQWQTAELARLRLQLTTRTVLYWLCLIAVVAVAIAKFLGAF